MERIWGGRKLESLFGKKLPANKRIGESWEIVDRPEAQSIVANGTWKGRTLHELWSQHRHEIFGQVPDAPRFPLLIKVLDAQEKLSLQVHPPEAIAARFGGEPKTECWYVAAAEGGAELFVGFCKAISPEEFKKRIENGTLSDCLHILQVKQGDAMFLPAGRFHGIGGGNLLIEIQQNSDTTYRMFDWNRTDDSTGKPRQLHIEQGLECIDFNDITPTLVESKGEVILKDQLFEVQKWQLSEPRNVAPPGQFAIICCLTGCVRCAAVDLRPGEFFLVPASLQDRQLQSKADGTTLLRITIPV